MEIFFFPFCSESRRRSKTKNINYFSSQSQGKKIEGKVAQTQATTPDYSGNATWTLKTPYPTHTPEATWEKAHPWAGVRIARRQLLRTATCSTRAAVGSSLMVIKHKGIFQLKVLDILDLNDTEKCWIRIMLISCLAKWYIHSIASSTFIEVFMFSAFMSFLSVVAS